MSLQYILLEPTGVDVLIVIMSAQVEPGIVEAALQTLHSEVRLTLFLKAEENRIA